MPLTCAAGLSAPALGPDGCTGWDLGLLELMSNWGSAETRSEVSGEAGRGGGGQGQSLRGARWAAGRWRQRGRGWTPEQAVRLESRKTRGKRGSGRKEEREKLNEKKVGLAEGQVAFPRGQRSLVPDASRSLPDSAGRSSVKFREGAGPGSSLNLPRPENVLSGRAAA